MGQPCLQPRYPAYRHASLESRSTEVCPQNRQAANHPREAADRAAATANHLQHLFTCSPSSCAVHDIQPRSCSTRPPEFHLQQGSAANSTTRYYSGIQPRDLPSSLPGTDARHHLGLFGPTAQPRQDLERLSRYILAFPRSRKYPMIATRLVKQRRPPPQQPQPATMRC